MQGGWGKRRKAVPVAAHTRTSLYRFTSDMSSCDIFLDGAATNHEGHEGPHPQYLSPSLAIDFVGTEGPKRSSVVSPERLQALVPCIQPRVAGRSVRSLQGRRVPAHGTV